jgi:hypothetical protein
MYNGILLKFMHLKLNIRLFKTNDFIGAIELKNKNNVIQISKCKKMNKIK